MNKKFPVLGCCGLDCGLCPRFYTEGPSKCPGCCGTDFESKHPSCPFITCCVKKKDLEVCAECKDFPCSRFDKETGETDSFVTHRRVISNQALIKESGIDALIKQQSIRMSILQTMLEHYNDGKNKSFYCLSAALLSIKSLKASLSMADKKIKEESAGEKDTKTKAKILKDFLNRFAADENEELRLRK